MTAWERCENYLQDRWEDLYWWIRDADLRAPVTHMAFWVTVMVIGVMFWIFIFMTFAPMVRYVFADQINLDVIAQIESNNNPTAVGKAGEIGTFQIMPCVLADYNRYNASNFNRNALFCHETNKTVARWYMFVRVPQMLKFYGIPVTTENVIYAWNCGIGNVVKGRIPKSTKEYMSKYSKLTGGNR